MPRGLSIDDTAASMRGFQLAVIVLFAVAVIVFALQNLEIVTFAFPGSNGRVALAL